VLGHLVGQTIAMASVASELEMGSIIAISIMALATVVGIRVPTIVTTGIMLPDSRD